MWPEQIGGIAVRAAVWGTGGGPKQLKQPALGRHRPSQVRNVTAKLAPWPAALSWRWRFVLPLRRARSAHLRPLHLVPNKKRARCCKELAAGAL
jgi:hypothetical protein